MRRFFITVLSIGFISLFSLTSCDDGGDALSANESNTNENTASVTYPTDRKYSDNHQWVKIDANGIARVGVTFEAIDEIDGEVISIELVQESPIEPADPRPKKEKTTLEDILKGKNGKKKKAYYTVGGSMHQHNTSLDTNPNLAGTDPMTLGWLFELDNVEISDYNSLMTASEYESYITP